MRRNLSFFMFMATCIAIIAFACVLLYLIITAPIDTPPIVSTLELGVGAAILVGGIGMMLFGMEKWKETDGSQAGTEEAQGHPDFGRLLESPQILALLEPTEGNTSMVYTNRNLLDDILDSKLDDVQLAAASGAYGTTPGSKPQMEQRLIAKLRPLPRQDPASYNPSTAAPATEWKCSNGHPNSTSANFCAACGEAKQRTEELEQMKALRQVSEAQQVPAKVEDIARLTGTNPKDWTMSDSITFRYNGKFKMIKVPEGTEIDLGQKTFTPGQTVLPLRKNTLVLRDKR